MRAYYNDNNKYNCAWLLNLMRAGLIAEGEIDNRSIEDIRPGDLDGFTQCHFFAGIGVWSYALKQSGWADSRPVWTGSCPCQPFSTGGERNGFDDERHLWPAFNWLIKQQKPPVIFGEQVASKDADPWIDLVQSDLEAMEYSVGAVPFPAAGVGAPTLRERIYWMAVSSSAGSQGWGSAQRRRFRSDGQTVPLRSSVWLANTSRGGREMEMLNSGRSSQESWKREAVRPGARSPIGGFWEGAEWIIGADDKCRPIEPGLSPLAHGPPERVGRLHGYGNAINAEQAIHFVDIAMEYRP